MKRLSLDGLFWVGAALAAVSVGLAAGPLPWRLAGESGLPRPAAAPDEPTAAAPVSLDAVLALAPFGRVAAPEAPAAPAQETALGLTLHGVVIAGAAGGSSAIVSGPSGPARSYMEGQAITDAATLTGVARDHVVLDVGGRREILSFPETRAAGTRRSGDAGANALRALVTGGGSNAASGASAPAADASANDPDAVIARYRERIRQNPQTVLDDLGLVATEAGYEIASDPSSGVRRAGLQPGDLVAKVNGQQVGNIETDRRFFDEVAASGRARIEVLRDGQRIVMTFPLR